MGPDHCIPHRGNPTRTVARYRRKRTTLGVCPPNPAKPDVVPSTSPFRDRPAPTYETFELDSRVIHDRYGLGRVVQLNTDRMNVKFGDVVIDIDTRSPKVHLL